MHLLSAQNVRSLQSWILLLIGLTATQANATEQPFRDDFDRESAPVKAGQSLGNGWQVQSQQFHIEGGQLSSKSDLQGIPPLVVQSDLIFDSNASFHLSCALTMQTLVPNKSLLAGLVFAYQDSGNYWNARISSAGHVQIIRRVDGRDIAVYNPHGKAEPIQLETGAPLQLHLRSDGAGRYTLQVENASGDELFQGEWQAKSGNTPPAGAIGLSGSRGLTAFDWFAANADAQASHIATSDTPVAAEPDLLPGALEAVYVERETGPLHIYLWGVELSETEVENPRPAVIFFHGGGWVGGHPKAGLHHARYFADQGLIAATVEYRVKNRHQSSPADAVADAMAVMRWLDLNATRLGLDTQRVVLMGGSAGGHLALVPGLLPEGRELPFQPAAVVAFNPVTNTTNGGFGDDTARQRNANNIGPNPESISPLHNLQPNAPPTLILHGTSDTVVPIEDSRAFVAAARALGCEARLIEYPGRPHGFFNFLPGNHNPLFTETLTEAADFIATTLQLDSLTSPKIWALQYVESGDPAAQIEPF